MIKKIFITFFLLIVSSIHGQSFSVTLDIQGHYYITNHNQISVSVIKYKPVGSSTFTGAQAWPTSYFNQFIFKLNPFIEWEFDINNGSYVLQSNHNFSGVNKSLGYSYNFENNNIVEGWRGYHAPYTQATTGIFNGNDGVNKFIRLKWPTNGHATFVSPRLNNLSNDKKISFWIRKTNNNSNLLPLYLEFGTIADPHNQNDFHLLKNEIVSSELFYKVTVYLDNYNGTDNFIAVRGLGSLGGEVDLDNFSYEQSVHCSDVTNAQVTNIQETTAALIFDTNQSLWEVELKNLLTNVVSTFTVSQNNYSLQNLTGNTNYQVRVRSKCDSDHFSNWSPTINFTTVCNLITAGYSTSFGEQQYYIDPCWKKITNVAGVYQGPSVSTTNAATPRTGTRMIEMYSGVGYSSSKKGYLITPFVQDLDNNKRIKFFLIGKGEYVNNSLTIGTMSDPNNSDTFIALKTISPEEMNEFDGYNVNSYWKEHIVYLDNYNISNNHHYIAFKQNFEDDGMFYIDDFTYENIPACKEPTNLTTLETDYNLVKVKWDNYQNSSSEWQVEYGPTGFTLGTGTVVMSTSNSFTINSNLTESTAYDFYVRSKCGNVYSNWSDRGYFKTKCIGIAANYSNNFENEDFANNSTCWRRTTPSIRDSWYAPSKFISFRSTSTYPSTLTHSGTKSLIHSVSNVPSELNEFGKTILITPRLLNFNNYKKISFWINFPVNNQVTSRSIEIGTLSNPNDYSTFTLFKTVIINAGLNQWEQINVDFPDYNLNDEYVGIRQSLSNGEGYFYIDDFEYLNNSCPRATGLKAVQTNNNTVNLNWQDNNSSFVTSSWDIEYGIKGFQLGTGTIVNATSNSFSLSGLLENTEYEYRVKTNCELTNVSLWSNVYLFKVSCVSNAPLLENFNQFDIENDPNWETNFCWTTNNNYILTNENYQGYEIPGIEDNSIFASINTGNIDPFGNGEVYKEYLISPFLSDFNNGKRVKFWATLNDVDYTQENQETVDLVIGTVSNPLDISTFIPFETISLNKSDYLGKEFIIDFSAYNGSDKYFVFIHGDNSGNSSRIYIDNIQYDNIQPCIEPLNLNVKSVNSSQALIAWENTMSNPNLVLEYGESGFQIGSGTQIIINNASEVLLSGLLETTTYDYYLHTQCINQSSFVVGPKTFTTTCSTLPLPWIEKFDTIPTYGDNLMPSCMKSDGSWKSKNTPIDNFGSYNADFNGVDDTYYAYATDGNVSNMFTPSFNLNAGTAYTLSFYQQKNYQFGYGGIAEVNTGLGNELVFMTNKLGVASGELSIDMSQFKYYFTPITSGNYTFLLASWNSGGYRTGLDNLELKEGYTNIINQDILTTTYQFQTPNDAILLEASENTRCEITTDPNNSLNKYVKMEGANNYVSNWNPSISRNSNIVLNSSSIWINNQNHISKINFKVNANLNVTNLYMSFDLKQTFRESNTESRFRVLVNGNQINNDILPLTNTSDLFLLKEIDLTPFIGQSINISLQHIGKNKDGIGDNAFVDNLKFTNSSVLSNTEHVFKNFNFYPNPFTNSLTLENLNPISKVELFNITGQKVFENNFSKNIISIDTSNLFSGVYFMKVFSDNENKTIKVIKN